VADENEDLLSEEIIAFKRKFRMLELGDTTVASYCRPGVLPDPGWWQQCPPYSTYSIAPMVLDQTKISWLHSGTNSIVVTLMLVVRIRYTDKCMVLQLIVDIHQTCILEDDVVHMHMCY
jgi:hypothetical protein